MSNVIHRSEQQVRQSLTSMLEACSQVAMADGVVTQDEQALLDCVKDGVAGLERQLMEMLTESLSDEAFQELLQQCFEHLVWGANNVALEDGIITGDEQAIIDTLLKHSAELAQSVAAKVEPAKPAKRVRIRPVKTTATVMEKIRETPDTHSLRLKMGESFPFKAGQFLMTKPEVNGKKVPRAYSISSSPTVTDYVQITVRQTREPTVSRHMNELQVGDSFEVRAPHGEFYWEPGMSETIFMIGGGSGITPLKAILEYVHDSGLDTPTTLLYSATTRENVILGETLKGLDAGTPSSRLYITLTRDEGGEGWDGATGRIDAQVIQDHLPGYEEGLFLLCGAPPFVSGMRTLLEEAGVPKERIKQERWS